MTGNSSILPKSLIIFGICIPLALLVGYLLATPADLMSVGLVSIVMLVLCLPLFLRWHHPALIFAWNANLSVYVLPGRPDLWMLLAGGSLLLTVVTCIMERRIRFQNVPSISWPLLFLTLVILVTAKLTGGIGLHSLGNDTYGGKKFFYLVAAIIGYFAISGRRIPADKAGRYSGLFFLSGLTGSISNLIYFAGPAFYILYYFFPVDNALAQAMDDVTGTLGNVRFGRLLGVTVAAMAAFYYILGRYGIRGLLTPTKPWRLALVLACFALSLLGGFRSAVIIFALICAAQFYFEGLHRTRLFPVLILGAALGGAFLVVFVTRLPLSVQRSLSMLPVEIDPAARFDAQASVDWRVEMWRALLPQVRQYLFLGKGYAIDPTDLYLVTESIRRGLAKDYEQSILSGDYHSGPLSVMIPFGIFGMIGFVWLLIAGGRVLYRNHKFSDPALQSINTFLLSYFVARALYYFIGFGSFSSDLSLFLGLLGFSVALNGDARERATVPAPAQSAVLATPLASEALV